MFEWQQDTRRGLLTLVDENRGYIESTIQILKRIHNIYITNNSHLYTKTELRWINYYLDSVVHKYYLACISIELLQVIRHGKTGESLWEAIENSLDRLDCSDNEQLIVSFALEAFLFESKAFLDIYTIYVCLLLRSGFTNGKMNSKRFFEELGKVNDPAFTGKAAWIKEYFEADVFGKDEDKATISRNDWGRLLQDLRDKVAHRDKLNLSFQSNEKFINEILLDWPTLKGMTYHLLAETIGNGMHALFYEVSAHIYELNWDDYQKVNS